MTERNTIGRLSALIRPAVTEKSTLLQERGKYTFVIAPWANKPQVKEAVQQAFKVTVTDVKVLRNRGRLKRRGLDWYRDPDIKKAVVTLKSGDKITIFEEV